MITRFSIKKWGSQLEDPFVGLESWEVEEDWEEDINEEFELYLNKRKA